MLLAEQLFVFRVVRSTIPQWLDVIDQPTRTGPPDADTFLADAFVPAFDVVAIRYARTTALAWHRVRPDLNGLNAVSVRRLKSRLKSTEPHFCSRFGTSVASRVMLDHAPP